MFKNSVLVKLGKLKTNLESRRPGGNLTHGESVRFRPRRRWETKRKRCRKAPLPSRVPSRCVSGSANRGTNTRFERNHNFQYSLNSFFGFIVTYMVK